MFTETATPAARRRLGHRILGSGLVEALAAPHGIDRYLELVRPGWSLHELRAEITAVRHPAPDSVTLTLHPNRNWRGFEPGQFVRLTVEIDGIRRSRCYSPACSARRPDGVIELTVRRHPGGLVSGFLHDRAVPGMVVGLEPASGDFVLPRPRPERLTLISGGSGITPVMSMLRTLVDEGYPGEIAFLHYARTPAHVPYAAELAQIAARPDARLTVALGYTRAAAAGAVRGRFEPDHLRAVGADPDAEIFVCGPAGLIDAVTAGTAGRVHAESFVPPLRALDGAAEATGAVSFARSERTLPNTGATLLEQAEAAGLNPAHGCRMGICHTCTCRKLAGEVRNVLTGEVSSPDEQDIQICISVPAGSVALDL
jgi:ferredoxin-NADP reductase